MKHTIALTLALLALAACASHDDDKAARAMLDEARISLQAHQYAAARDTLHAMRRRYPRAIAVRREALLVEDSIELEAALDTLMSGTPLVDMDEMARRAKFYQKKLQHDAETLKK